MDAAVGAAKAVAQKPWSDLQKELAGHMLGMGLPNDAVARTLGRTVASIVGARHRGTVIPKPGLEPLDLSIGDRRHWTAAEDRLLGLLVQHGLADGAIGETLGRTGGAVQSRKTRLGLACARYPSKQKPKASWRACMCCGGQFYSEGIHNRLCLSCKETYCRGL